MMVAANEPLRYRRFQTPLGSLVIAGAGGALHFVGMPGPSGPRSAPATWVLDPTWGEEIARQLEAYFDGSLRSFEIELAPGGTTFQRRIWNALIGIPYGETRSYGQVAESIGASRAVRAVGRANATNPIPIVIPCHRVIGSDGTLTGYGGGLDAKRWLLDLERRVRFTSG
jgi:methylated-DNA-[protein]-cysteine S-methyltransferase